MAIKKKKLNIPNIWMTVYGDFITNETLFFMLLFGSILMAVQYGFDKEQLKDFMTDVSSAVYQQKKTRGEAQEAKGRLQQIPGVSGVTVAGREIRVILPETVLFDPGKAKLKDGSLSTLAAVGAILAKTPYRVAVDGHTCDLPVRQNMPAGMPRWQLSLSRSTGLGPYFSNRELSGARAMQVANYLIKEGILPPDRLAVSACGAANPLAPNTSEENRAKNRRIEIKVVMTGA